MYTWSCIWYFFCVFVCILFGIIGPVAIYCISHLVLTIAIRIQFNDDNAFNCLRLKCFLFIFAFFPDVWKGKPKNITNIVRPTILSNSCIIQMNNWYSLRVDDIFSVFFSISSRSLRFYHREKHRKTVQLVLFVRVNFHSQILSFGFSNCKLWDLRCVISNTEN